MTHDELLAKLTDYEAHFDQVLDEPRIYAALCAVVELHSMEEWGKDGPLSIYMCGKCRMPYPCDNIQAIEKELQ